MNFNLSKRITLGYIFIILTALLTSAYSIHILLHNNELDEKITAVYLPLYLNLKDLEAVNHEMTEFSSYLSTQESSYEQRKLVESIDARYRQIRKNLNDLLLRSEHETSDSIQYLVAVFDQIIAHHQHTVNARPVMLVSNMAEHKGMPWAAQPFDSLKKTFNTRLPGMLRYWQQQINNLQEEKENSDTFLSFLLMTMVTIFIIAVVIVYSYIRRTVVKPIIGVKDLIVTLGEGRTVDVHVNGRTDEIGKIMHAMNSLTQGIRIKSEFATKVGKGNYTEQLELLSEDDEMGRALLNMRDNLKRSVEEERKHAWENKRLAMVVNKTTNIVILADINGTIEWVNPAFSRITGYPSEEVIDKHLSVLIQESNIDAHLMELGQKMLQEGQGFKDVELISYTKAGTPYWVSVEVQPIVNKLGFIEEYIVIGTDISDRKSVQKNLEERNAELEKINSELDRFVYSASHDLRAPISSLLGLIEVARLEKDPAAVGMLMDKQKSTLLRLDRFIKDIVNYSRNSRLEVESEQIDFEFMIKTTFDQLQYMENVQRIRKIITVHQAGKFYSSPTRISMVLNNLIANGIKYADMQKEEPFLKVIVRADDSFARIRISDNGEGIPEDAQEKIFNMFYRASEKSSGSGLGLYIAKEALQKIGGSIDVQSEYRKGTEFTITIPCRNRWN